MVLTSIAALALACSELETAMMQGGAGGSAASSGSGHGGTSGVGSGGSGGGSGGSISVGSGGSAGSSTGGSGGSASGGSGGSSTGGSGGSASGGSPATGGSSADPNCDPPQHACGGSCVANDIAACGDACTVCPVPQNGAASCTDGACGAVCNNGFHDCEDASTPGTFLCADDTEVASCGDRCEPCPAPSVGGTATCIERECGVDCDDEYGACADASTCQHLRWLFEDGTIQGWSLNVGNSRAVTGALEARTEWSSDGDYALRIPYTASGDNRNIMVRIVFCPGEEGYMNVRDRQVSAAVRFEESSGSSTYQVDLELYTTLGTGPVSEAPSVAASNTATILSALLDGDNAVETAAVGLYVYIPSDATGFMWIDSVVIN